MLSTAFIYMKIAKKLRFEKIIAHARNSNSDSIIKLGLIRLAKFYATDLVAVSRLAADKFFGKNAASKARIFYNSIEIQKYHFDLDYRFELIKEFNLYDRRIIGHIGRFHPAKNHKFLIKIFYKLVLLDPSFTLVLVGTGSEKAKIEKLVSNLGLNNNIIFTGARIDAYKFYSLFDLFLLPSHYEGFPGVILEAQVSGVPILMSRNVTDEVIYNQNVIKLSLKNKKRWIQKIQNDVNLNRQVDVIIVSKIKSIDAVVDEYLQLYSHGR
jgi:glycosyltransferase involved in cell wall biosynthesis